MIYGVGRKERKHNMKLKLDCKKVKDIQIGEQMYYNKDIWEKIEMNNKNSQREYGVFSNISSPSYTNQGMFLSDELIVIVDEYILCGIESKNKKLKLENNSK